MHAIGEEALAPPDAAAFCCYNSHFWTSLTAPLLLCRWADRAAEVTAAEAEMRGRYTDARRQLGGLTREVQRLARLLDEVPSQSELLQYERRFAELGEQVRSKMGGGSRWRARARYRCAAADGRHE